MHPTKMNMINIHTNERKKKYILYIPRYYFTTNEFKSEDIDNILLNAKKLLFEYVIKSKIVCIIITDELQEPSFPVVHPKSNIEEKFKFNPLKVINITS
jgi:hypothetical protein